MEKSTPKERKTRAKAAAPVQPENSDTPAENAAEQQPAADTPSVEQPAPVPSENASDSVKKSDTAASPRSRGKNYSESRRKAQSGEPEQDTFFENAQPDLLVVPAEPVGAVSFGPPEDDSDDSYTPAPEPISATYVDPAPPVTDPDAIEDAYAAAEQEPASGDYRRESE